MKTTAIVLALVLSVCSAFIRFRNSLRPMCLSAEKKEKFHKGELIEMISDQTGFNKNDVTEIIDAFIDIVKTDVMMDGKECKLVTF